MVTLFLMDCGGVNPYKRALNEIGVQVMSSDMNAGRKGGLLALGAVLVFALSACGAGNKGGDTGCGDYLEMNSSEQKAVISKMLEDKGRDPSNGEIQLNKASATLFCNTVGSNSSKISEIDG